MLKYNKLSLMIFKDKVALLCICVLSACLIISFISPLILLVSPNDIFEKHLNIPPFWMQGGLWQFPLGTDDLGRDFLIRLIYGGKTSFLIGALVVLFSVIFGLLFGSLAALYQKLDPWIVGAVDILMSFPGLFLALVIMAILGTGLVNACIAVSLACLPIMIRLVRSLVLRELAQNYVIVSRSQGASKLRIIIYHILPNCLGDIQSQALLIFSEGILSVAALSFLGLGTQAPVVEWGLMIADGRAYLETSWWLVTFPGLCILTMVFCINILGEKLRDFFDPKTLMLL